MNHLLYIKASVLATVIVVCMVMLLGVLAVISLWETDLLTFSQSYLLRIQRANIESAFKLYKQEPQILEHLKSDSTYLLYDSLPTSQIKFECKAWGLYEIVSITALNAQRHSSFMFGFATATDHNCNFYYSNNGSPLTLTGNTNLHGQLQLPTGGIIYGQMQSQFFSGERIELSQITKSLESLPKPSQGALDLIDRLFTMLNKSEFDQITSNSMSTSFYRLQPNIFNIGSGVICNCWLSGNIILLGESIILDSTALLHDVIVVARNITVGSGFKGRAQLFAQDSIIVNKNASLLYPSGVFSRSYMQIDDYAQVNGYVIVTHVNGQDIKAPNYKQSRLSTIRGLLYVNGIAQLQGIVSGAVFINQAIYYSPQGYYRHMIYDASILENSQMAYPLWLTAPKQRKEVIWLH